MNINKLLSLLLVKLKYIILIALIFAIGAFGFTKFFVAEQYTSSAKFLVIMDENSSKSTEANFVKEAIHSYLEIFNTTKFFNGVAEALNSYNDGTVYSNYTSGRLKSMTSIKASSNSDAPSFTISVQSSDRDSCYEVANVVAEHMIEKSLDYKVLNKIELIDDPIKPVTPSSPNVINNMLTAFVIGAALTIAVIVLKEVLDKKIKNLEDITASFNIPILGVIPDTSPENTGKRTKNDKED